MMLRAIANKFFLAIVVFIFAGCARAQEGISPFSTASTPSHDMMIAEEVASEAEPMLPAAPVTADFPVDFNTEEYDRIYENQFLDTLSNPLSTVSIDVDTASYSNARRFIIGNPLPFESVRRLGKPASRAGYCIPASGTRRGESAGVSQEDSFTRLHFRVE